MNSAVSPKSNTRHFSNLKKMMKGKGLFVIFLVVFLFLSIASDRFLSSENIANILRNTSIAGMLSLGLTIIMVSGEFDLSFGGAVSLINLMAMILFDQGYNIVLVFIFIVIASILWQMFNALLVVKFRMHAFIATIASLTMSKGFIYWITKGSTFYGDYPDYLTVLGRHTFVGILPANALVFIILAFVIYMFLNKSKYGRYLYAIGSNPEASEYVGIQVNKYRVLAYVLGGFCFGIATITLCSKLATAPATAGDGFQMQVISSAFLGAAAFRVGKVNVSGSILAIFILTTIQNGLIMLSVPFYFQYIVEGLILITAVTFVSRNAKAGEGPSIY